MLRPTYTEATGPQQLPRETRPFELPELTIYITDSCALSCEGCITYNNFALGSHLELTEQVQERIRAWSKTTRVHHIYVIGGEPLSHPHLSDWLQFISATFDSPRKTIVSNGRDLNAHTQLLADSMEQGWDLEISSHSRQDHDSATAWWHGVSGQLMEATVAERQRDQHGITDYWRDSEGRPLIQIGLRDHFYPANYDIQDGVITWPTLQPASATHRACPARQCAHLVDGIMYRCPVQATLPRLAQRFQVEEPAASIARATTSYDPLQPRGSLSAWMSSMTQPQPQCSLCRWPNSVQALSDPTVKKIKLTRAQ